MVSLTLPLHIGKGTAYYLRRRLFSVIINCFYWIKILPIKDIHYKPRLKPVSISSRLEKFWKFSPISPYVSNSTKLSHWPTSSNVETKFLIIHKVNDTDGLDGVAFTFPVTYFSYCSSFTVLTKVYKFNTLNALDINTTKYEGSEKYFIYVYLASQRKAVVAKDTQAHLASLRVV